MSRQPTPPSAGLRRGAFPWLAAASVLALGYAALSWWNPVGAGGWAPFGPSMATPDSASYLRLDADPRTWAGYPAFLALVVGLFGTPEAVPPIQAAITAASALFLARAAARVSGAPLLAPVAALAVLAPSAASRFDAYLLSEALFVPLLVAALGCAALAAARPTAARFAAGAACAALAVAVELETTGVNWLEAVRDVMLPSVAANSLIAVFAYWPARWSRRIRFGGDRRDRAAAAP